MRGRTTYAWPNLMKMAANRRQKWVIGGHFCLLRLPDRGIAMTAMPCVFLVLASVSALGLPNPNSPPKKLTLQRSSHSEGRDAKIDRGFISRTGLRGLPDLEHIPNDWGSVETTAGYSFPGVAAQ